MKQLTALQTSPTIQDTRKKVESASDFLNKKFNRIYGYNAISQEKIDSHPVIKEAI